jgi:hypothetical protein
VSASISPHTKASRDSMTPSATSGATTGSAACKMHAKRTRGSSVIMMVLPRNGGSRRGWDFPKPRTEDRQNGANIPKDSSENRMRRRASDILARTAQTPAQRGSHNQPGVLASRVLRRDLGGRAQAHRRHCAYLMDSHCLKKGITPMRKKGTNRKAKRQPLSLRHQRLARPETRRWRNCGRPASVSRNNLRTRA